jgi:hypothetical protein
VPEFPALTDGDVELELSESLLWRSVPEGFIDGGRITSQAFRPTRKDAGRLSVAQQVIVSAPAHFQEMTTEFGIQSVGVWAVAIDEVDGTGARVVDDRNGQDAPRPCPTGHAFVDFRDCPSNGKIAKRAGHLRDIAIVRGRVYPPWAGS